MRFIQLAVIVRQGTLPKCRLLLRNERRKLFYHTQLLAVVLQEIEEFFILSFPKKL